MKSYDYDAVTFDGCVYCNECLPEGIKEDDPEVSPVFADSEWDSYPVCDKCHAEHDYVSLTSDGWIWLRERNGPQEEDITITPSGHLGSMYSVGVVNGDFIGEYPDFEEAINAIRNWMHEHNYYPDVWDVSDHGNASLLTFKKREG